MYSKIYLSGKITGLTYEQAFDKFAKAEKTASALAKEVINPMTLNHNHDKSWENYMLEDIKYLFSCDSIFMLDNWNESKGARIEWFIAKEMKIEMFFEKEKRFNNVENNQQNND
jgi:hypothetical protein